MDTPTCLFGPARLARRQPQNSHLRLATINGHFTGATDAQENEPSRPPHNPAGHDSQHGPGGRRVHFACRCNRAADRACSTCDSSSLSAAVRASREATRTSGLPAGGSAAGACNPGPGSEPGRRKDASNSFFSADAPANPAVMAWPRDSSSSRPAGSFSQPASISAKLARGSDSVVIVIAFMVGTRVGAC